MDRFRASTPGADPSVAAEKVGPGTPIEPRIEREHGEPDLRLRAQLARPRARADRRGSRGRRAAPDRGAPLASTTPPRPGWSPSSAAASSTR
ncbi:MAG: hypothetical protein R2736_19750 [Solirubrobacterales bacterium]